MSIVIRSLPSNKKWSEFPHFRRRDKLTQVILQTYFSKWMLYESEAEKLERFFETV